VRVNEIMVGDVIRKTGFFSGKDRVVDWAPWKEGDKWFCSVSTDGEHSPFPMVIGAQHGYLDQEIVSIHRGGKQMWPNPAQPTTEEVD